MKSNSKIRLGVAGVGYLGKFHAEKCTRIKDAKLTAVADTNFETASKIGQQFSCSAYSDYSQLIGKVDAAIIALPTSIHFEAAKALLEGGAHLFIEKPIAVDLKEADELIEIARQKDLIIQVGHIERFNPAFCQVKEKIKNPLFIESKRVAPYSPRCSDVSIVLDLMIHDIDLILNIVNSDIAQIKAFGTKIVSNTIDTALAIIDFKNKTTATIKASRIAETSVREMSILQTDELITLDFASPCLSVLSGNNGDQEIKKTNFTKPDALDIEVQAFVESIIKNKTPIVDAVSARYALKVAIDIINIIELAD